MNAIRSLRAPFALGASLAALAFIAGPAPVRAHSDHDAHRNGSQSHGTAHYPQCKRHGRDSRNARWRRPMADAGPDQAAFAGQTVTLDGSRSRDPDGDQLKYLWEIVKRPKASRARLSERRSVMPTLAVDVNGQYVIALLVRSCDGTSNADFVVVRVSGNVPPVANAGSDQTVFVGDRVQLDGSASNDPNGDALSFAWQLVAVPSGSQAALSDAGAVRPTLVPDLRGDYVVQLTVNDARAASAPDVVTVHTQPGNSPPVANAGPDQSSRVGATVVLDGRGSSDPDGDALRYEWTLVTQPDASTTVLRDVTSPQPTFYVDADGQYVAELRVCDASACAEPDSVVVAAAGNSVPVAVPGADQTVDAGASVSLDGRASSDPDGDPLSFAWSLTAVPAGSSAQLDDPASLAPRFVADVAGEYLVQLLVNDGLANSAPATLLVTARNALPIAGDDASTTAEDTAVTIPVLDNDSDANGDVLTLSTVSQPASGGSVVIEGGSVRFTPARDFSGSASFDYSVTDGRGGSDSATVTVLVTPVNDAPSAAADSASTLAGEAVTIDVLGNDTDPEGDALSVAAVDQPASGGTAATNGVSVTFTPAAGFVGTTSFTYTVSDGALTGTAQVTVTVRPPPTLSIADGSVVEGNSGSRALAFVVTLSEASTRTVSATFNTVSQSASAGTDFIALRSTVSFTPGVVSRTVNIAVLGDTLVEGDETFAVNLMGPVNATLADSQAIGTIVNDD